MAIEGDWSSYNDALVRRGYIGIDPSMLDSWRRELKRENRGKVGLPYRYHESFIRLIAYIRMIFHPATGRQIVSSSSSPSTSKAYPSQTTRPLRGGPTAWKYGWTAPW